MKGVFMFTEKEKAVREWWEQVFSDAGKLDDEKERQKVMEDARKIMLNYYEQKAHEEHPKEVEELKISKLKIGE